MERNLIPRRHFLTQTALAATAFSAAPSQPIHAADSKPARGPQGMLRLGGPSFAKTEDPEELALAHRKLGYRAADCPNVSLEDAARIKAHADAFAKHDVVIAEVGRWVNLLDADEEKRKQNL